MARPVFLILAAGLLAALWSVAAAIISPCQAAPAADGTAPTERLTPQQETADCAPYSALTSSGGIFVPRASDMAASDFTPDGRASGWHFVQGYASWADMIGFVAPTQFVPVGASADGARACAAFIPSFMPEPICILGIGVLVVALVLLARRRRRTEECEADQMERFTH